jgi:Mn2+/Fe2+ NRAMP family transporter
MKKFGIEIKWGIIFTIVMLLWMWMEKMLGWHDEHIDKQRFYTLLFAVPAILIYVLALLDKRKNHFNEKMTWVQGFITGLGITLVVAALSPLTQYIVSEIITPNYFENAIDYAVKSGELDRVRAQEYFNLKNYIWQSLMSAVGMGVFTSAIVALFVKKK